MTRRTYKYRIYPNKEQEELINKTFGSCRFIYNTILDYKIKYYEKTGKSYTKNQSINDLKKVKDLEEYKWLKEVDSIALQQTLINLDKAFKNFFKYKKGFPKFKSKKNKQSYRTIKISKTNIDIDYKNNKIKIPKIGYIKFKDNREIKEEIKSVTISKTKTNKYFASILTSEEVEDKQKPKKIKNSISLDMSARDFLISEERQFTNPKFYRNVEHKLKRLNQSLSRKKKGSNNRKKARLKLCKFYEKITNKRKDFLHKLTKELIDKYDAIFIEDLNIQGMQQFSKGLSKTVTLDFSWYEFTKQLEYKSNWYGKHFIKVDRYFPSSKQCSNCNHINKDLKLSDRKWICPSCSEEHDRDINASRNIKKEGMRILKNTVGTTEIKALNTGKSKKIYPLEDMSRNLIHSVQESTSFMS